MKGLIKNIQEMGLDWFLCNLEVWLNDTEVDNAEGVMEDLNNYLEEERSYTEN